MNALILTRNLHWPITAQSIFQADCDDVMLALVPAKPFLDRKGESKYRQGMYYTEKVLNGYKKPFKINQPVMIEVLS